MLLEKRPVFFITLFFGSVVCFCIEYQLLLFITHLDIKIFHHIWSITHHLISKLY